MEHPEAVASEGPGERVRQKMDTEKKRERESRRNTSEEERMTRAGRKCESARERERVSE